MRAGIAWDVVARMAAEGHSARQIVDELKIASQPGALRFRAAQRGISIRLATREEISAECEARRAVWTPEREAELRQRLAAGETCEAISRGFGLPGRTVREKAARMGLRLRPRPHFLPAASATPEGANAPRALPSCLPVPKVSGPILPAIAALLEAA